MWYTLKEEPTGWKVIYLCDPADGCGYERRLGKVSMSEVDSIDDAYRRAVEMGNSNL